jgi:RND superfamily putative drug exporter
MVARFREELAVQPTVHEAVVKTIRTAGRTILFSGITVIVSLLSLSFFPVTLLRSISLGGASAVALTLVAALIILPCILLLLGHRINRWRLGMPVRSHTKKDAPNLWSRVAGWVTRRPIISLLGSLLIVGFLASPLMNVHFIARDYRALPTGTSAKVVAEALTNNFGVGQSPVVVLVTVDDIASEKGLAALLDASSQIKNIHGVSSVVGLSTISPGASAAELYNLAYGPASKHNPQLPALKKQYVAGNTAQLLVTYTDGGPSDATAQAIVRDVRALKSDSFSVIVGGQPAVQYDLVATILKYLPYALATIVITIMIFLSILLRSILIPIQAIVINSFAILASLGIVVWIFQEGNLTNISWLVKTGGLDVTTPLLVCTIAFGLSMDYAVFLYSRIHEEYLKTKDTTLAIVNGVRLTGSIITEAATLFFIVVIAFATSAIPMLQQIGLGMAIAVIIDAFFVRIIIVPAVMKLVGRANWL